MIGAREVGMIEAREVGMIGASPITTILRAGHRYARPGVEKLRSLRAKRIHFPALELT